MFCVPSGKLVCCAAARALRCSVAREDAALADANGEPTDLAGPADHDMSREMLNDALEPAKSHRCRNCAQVEVLVLALGAPRRP